MDVNSNNNSLVPLTVRVTEDLRKQVKQIALNGNVSVQQLLTELITNFTKTYGSKK